MAESISNSITSTINDVCVNTYPSNQTEIDLFEDWSSSFPPQANVKAGTANLFADDRVAWAVSQLGGVDNKNILELGPLEGAHSYMLSRAGAKSVLAIEANKRCFLKCLITKNMLNLNNVTFRLGDFMPFLERGNKFDVIWAAGVLYHMKEPVRLLELISESTKQVHIWTHYVPDAGPKGNEPWAVPIQKTETIQWRGRSIKTYVRSYFNQPAKATYCGGIATDCAWLRRSDILDILKGGGFSNVKVSFELPDHPHGPAFAIAASK